MHHDRFGEASRRAGVLARQGTAHNRPEL